MKEVLQRYRKTSIDRFLDGVTEKNVLLWDIRRFYKDEYQVGLWALDLIEDKCKVRLPEDEAGFIALHLANAQIEEEIFLLVSEGDRDKRGRTISSLTTHS